MHTIEEAKAYLRAAAHGKGANCPACNQFVKIYRRHITAAMSKSLILIAKNQTGSDYIHVNNLLTEHRHLNSDWAKFEYWGLIERAAGDRDDGSKRNGLWRMTEKGRQFVRNEIRIPSWADVYNGKTLGFAPTTVSIRETAGVEFDYDRAMQTGLDL